MGLYMCTHIISPIAPTVAPSGLGGGGGDRNELIITWTVSVSEGLSMSAALNQWSVAL